MYEIFNAFNVKEIIKAAGGRWNGEKRCWTLTDEQHAALPEGMLAGCRVLTDNVTVCEMEAGATFRFVVSGSKVLAQAPDGRTYAWWEKTVTRAARGISSHYDKHRRAKGDSHEYDEEYTQGGDTARILGIVKANLPQAFHDVGWFIRQEGDEYSVFEFVKGLVPGQCVWYGNTDKKVIAAVKRAQKTLTFQT